MSATAAVSCLCLWAELSRIALLSVCCTSRYMMPSAHENQVLGHTQRHAHDPTDPWHNTHEVCCYVMPRHVRVTSWAKRVFSHDGQDCDVLRVGLWRASYGALLFAQCHRHRMCRVGLVKAHPTVSPDF